MRINIYRCSLPTSVQWQFSGIPPPPQLLTPNLFIPYQGWGSSLGSGHIPGSEPSPRTASQNMRTICYQIKCKGELVNRLSGSDALPRWQWPAPSTLSLKNPLQKPTGDVMDTTSIFFTVYDSHTKKCEHPWLRLTFWVVRSIWFLFPCPWEYGRIRVIRGASARQLQSHCKMYSCFCKSTK